MDSIQTATDQIETGDVLAEEALSDEVVDSESAKDDSLSGEMATEEVLTEEESGEDVLVEEAPSEEAFGGESGVREAFAEEVTAAEAPTEEQGEDVPSAGTLTREAEHGTAVQETEEALPDSDSAGEMGDLPVEDWDYQQPKRGQIRPGVILSIGEQEIIVDVDAKRDGLVPFADMQRMGAEALAELSVGDEVMVYILRPEDQDGNLLVSLYQARQAQAWQHVGSYLESGEVIETEVIGYNKGGLVAPVQEIRGFIPASQVPGFPQGLRQEERLERLSALVGEKIQVKVIEFNRRNRRLILSATAAQRQWRKRERERLLDALREGEVRRGRVSSLCSFGAFVDLGGADGLVHLSELSWRRVRHPREVLRVGQEVDVYVLRLDHERRRIGLSLKRLQAEPWALVEDKYELGQLVEGVVTNVVDFGAFAEIEEGVEGLIHVSELSDQPISHPKEVVKKGDLLLLRIIRIDIRRKRLGLSLKRVLESEWAEWAARLALDEAEAAKAAEPEPIEADEEEAPASEVPVEVDEVQEPLLLEGAGEDEEPAIATSFEQLSEAEEAPTPAEAEMVPEAEPIEGEEEAATMLAEEYAVAEEVPEPPEAEENLEQPVPVMLGEDEWPPEVSQAHEEEILVAPAPEETDEVQGGGEQPEGAKGPVLDATGAEEPAEPPEVEVTAEAEGEDVAEDAADGAGEGEEAPALPESGQVEAASGVITAEPGEDNQAQAVEEADEPKESA